MVRIEAKHSHCLIQTKRAGSAQLHLINFDSRGNLKEIPGGSVDTHLLGVATITLTGRAVGGVGSRSMWRDIASAGRGDEATHTGRRSCDNVIHGIINLLEEKSCEDGAGYIHVPMRGQWELAAQRGSAWPSRKGYRI